MFDSLITKKKKGEQQQKNKNYLKTYGGVNNYIKT